MDLEDIVDPLIFTGAIPMLSDRERLNKKLGGMKSCSIKISLSDVHLITADLFPQEEGFNFL